MHRWTREENDRLLEMFKAGAARGEMAKTFGVSERSVGSKLRQWGLVEPRECEYRRWKLRDENILSALWVAGRTQEEIAKIIGRSRHSVASKISALGLRGAR